MKQLHPIRLNPNDHAPLSMTRYWLILFFFILISTVPAQETILWKVNSPDQKHTTYLLGTFHLMGNSFVDSLPIIASSLINSEMAVFETIGGVDEVRAMMNARSEKREYETILNTDDIAFVKNISADWAVPVTKLTPIEFLIKLDQIYIENACGLVKPSDTWNHFEHYLIHLANQNNIPLYALETDSFQMEDINAPARNYSWNDFKKPIDNSLKNLKKSKPTKKQCRTAWDYMSFKLDYQFDEECAESRGLKKRNDEWMTQLPEILETKNAFIAVGMMHLYGQCGLIVQLKAAGFTVEPVEMH